MRTITHANYRHYSYVYSIMRNDGMTKLNVAAAMNISFRNADLFEYDYKKRRVGNEQGI